MSASKILDRQLELFHRHGEYLVSTLLFSYITVGLLHITYQSRTYTHVNTTTDTSSVVHAPYLDRF